jgi:polysaccharide export outer membrane protein
MRLIRPMLMFLCLVLALTTSCSSPGGGAPKKADDAAPPKPTLSVSTTRTVPLRDVEMPEVEVVPPVAGETGVTFYRLKVGDPVIIHLRGIYPRDEMVEDLVDEDGKVTVPLIGDIQAAGKSTSQLEADITKLYISGNYYKAITINVVMPSRTYYIRGEVRAPGRYPIVGVVTIMQAIAAAGGYTEFASQRNVKLIRNDTTTSINIRSIERNPDRDLPLESGDVIIVERSIL